MRHPRRPPRCMETGWALRFRTTEEEGSPVMRGCFMSPSCSFRFGGSDARSWRFRCRVMAAISLVTYVPFIVYVAIFA
ncbi:hypothetical protein V8E53_013575 [Lactarius tabidus]